MKDWGGGTSRAPYSPPNLQWPPLPKFQFPLVVGHGFREVFAVCVCGGQ